jgi:hypothetical protein
VTNSQDIWADIRVTSEKLSDLSVRLHDAASEAREAAQGQHDRNSRLRFELLQNLKKLADQIREILWREMQSSANGKTSVLESKNRAAELFTLLARIAATQENGSGSRSFFEEIESTVDRTLSRVQGDDPSGQDSTTKAA